MDVKTAFLIGALKEEIYIKIPEGLIHSQNTVCKFKKAIYGLKQAARCWFQVFEDGDSGVDRYIYIIDKGDMSENIYILLYVDDVVIATKNINTMTNLKSYLMEKFKMTDFKDTLLGL